MSAVGILPDVVAKPLMTRLAIDRTAALLTALTAVRRGGTVSISGVYGGQLDPLPMMTMFDRGSPSGWGSATSSGGSRTSGRF